MFCEWAAIGIKLFETYGLCCSTKLDAEKRLAIQQEKQALETKLLDVYVASLLSCVLRVTNHILTRPKMRARLEELRALA